MADDAADEGRGRERERAGAQARENKIVIQTIEDKAYKNVLDWSVCRVCVCAQTNVPIKDMEIRYLF